MLLNWHDSLHTIHTATAASLPSDCLYKTLSGQKPAVVATKSTAKLDSYNIIFHNRYSIYINALFSSIL